MFCPFRPSLSLSGLNPSPQAWYMDDLQDDQRKTHQQVPNLPVPPAELRALGIIAWHIDPASYETNDKYLVIRKVKAKGRGGRAVSQVMCKR